LFLTQKEMNDWNMERITETFAVLNLLHASIRKRQDVKYLPNIYSLF